MMPGMLYVKVSSIRIHNAVALLPVSTGMQARAYTAHCQVFTFSTSIMLDPLLLQIFSYDVFRYVRQPWNILDLAAAGLTLAVFMMHTLCIGGVTHTSIRAVAGLQVSRCCLVIGGGGELHLTQHRLSHGVVWLTHVKHAHQGFSSHARLTSIAAA